MEDNYSEILRKIDTEDNSIDNYKILRNKSNNQMKTLISQNMNKLQQYLEEPLQLIEEKDNQDNKEINSVKKELFSILSSIKDIEKEVNDYIGTRKNSIKITRNISKHRIKPDTSREMILNSSLNIKPNPELKKELKKPSFKASNQFYPKNSKIKSDLYESNKEILDTETSNNDNKFFKKVNNIKIHNYIYSGVRQLKQAFNKDRDSINKTFNKDIPPNKALYKTFRENKDKSKTDNHNNRSRSYRTNSNLINTERGHNYTRSELVNNIKGDMNETVIKKNYLYSSRDKDKAFSSLEKHIQNTQITETIIN